MYEIDLQSVSGFLSSFLRLSGGALCLDQNAFVAAVEERGGTLIALIIVLIAGMSHMLGQSVVLVANHVSPRRFAFSLVTGTFALIAGIGLWAGSAWLIATIALSAQPRFLDVLVLVWLSHAPFLFGLLVLLPYLGNAIDKALRLWVLLALMVALHAVYGAGFWSALGCAVAGWAVALLILRTPIPSRLGLRSLPGAVNPSAPRPPPFHDPSVATERIPDDPGAPASTNGRG
jgi:hypothetical protein